MTPDIRLPGVSPGCDPFVNGISEIPRLRNHGFISCFFELV
ncbi:MAG: hypothetical protein ACRC10_12690 [Thermoguttaceae bacterium]